MNGNGIYDAADGDTYDDWNGNGSWDAAETYTDLDGSGSYTWREWYWDCNGNGVWDGETYTDTNGNGTEPVDRCNSKSPRLSTESRCLRCHCPAAQKTDNQKQHEHDGGAGNGEPHATGAVAGK